MKFVTDSIKFSLSNADKGAVGFILAQELADLILLAIAALENLDIQSVDVKTVYFYGDLDEEIYIEQPEGFKLPGKENKVW